MRRQASPDFLAAANAYRSGLIPLGYAAFFSWVAAKKKIPELTPGYLMKLVRHVARRSRLSHSDQRFINVTHDWQVKFPVLYKRKDHLKQQKGHEEYLDEMDENEFALNEVLRDRYAGLLEDEEDRQYARYWFRASFENKIRPLLSDRKFLAGLDAASKGHLSPPGVIENVYGDARILFPELGAFVSALVLGQMVQAVKRGDISIPDGLREEFPKFYRNYFPEIHGRRPD